MTFCNVIMQPHTSCHLCHILLSQSKPQVLPILTRSNHKEHEWQEARIIRTTLESVCSRDAGRIGCIGMACPSQCKPCERDSTWVVLVLAPKGHQWEARRSWREWGWRCSQDTQGWDKRRTMSNHLSECIRILRETEPMDPSHWWTHSAFNPYQPDSKLGKESRNSSSAPQLFSFLPLAQQESEIPSSLFLPTIGILSRADPNWGKEVFTVNDSWVLILV